jgi:hypothetical protein
MVRSGWRVISPHGVDELVCGQLPGVGGEEGCEHALLPWSAELDVGITVNDPQWAEYREVHGTTACSDSSYIAIHMPSGSFLDRR